MTFNGIDFSWVEDNVDKKRLIALWRAAVEESNNNTANETNDKKCENEFKKAFAKIREKQIITRKEAFEKAHGKLNREISAFGNLIKLD